MFFQWLLLCMGIGTGGQDRTECLFETVLMYCSNTCIFPTRVLWTSPGTSWWFVWCRCRSPPLSLQDVNEDLNPMMSNFARPTVDGRAKMFKRVQPLAAIGQNSEIQPISSTFYAWMRPWKRLKDLKRLSQPPWSPGWDRLLWWNMPILASRILKASSRHAHHICANIN